MILSGGEFIAATAENSINLLRAVYEKYQHIFPIWEVITDYGTQFYVNKRDLHENSEHSFELFCKEMGIQHTLSPSKASADKWKAGALVPDICKESSEIRGL